MIVETPMRLIWMRPSGRPSWPFWLAANLSASRRAELITAVVLTAGVAVAPPCVPVVSRETPSSRLAVCCHVSNVSLSCPLIACCSYAV